MGTERTEGTVVKWGRGTEALHLTGGFIPPFLSLRLGTCQFSELSCEVIVALRQIINVAFSSISGQTITHPPSLFVAGTNPGGDPWKQRAKNTEVMFSHLLRVRLGVLLNSPIKKHQTGDKSQSSNTQLLESQMRRFDW